MVETIAAQQQMMMRLELIIKARDLKNFQGNCNSSCVVQEFVENVWVQRGETEII